MCVRRPLKGYLKHTITALRLLPAVRLAYQHFPHSPMPLSPPFCEVLQCNYGNINSRVNYVSERIQQQCAHSSKPPPPPQPPPKTTTTTLLQLQLHHNHNIKLVACIPSVCVLLSVSLDDINACWHQHQCYRTLSLLSVASDC